MDITITTKNGREVRGKIVELKNNSIAVTITWPYINYTLRNSNTGFNADDINFIQSCEAEAAKLLNYAYGRMHSLNESIERISGGYKKLKDRLKEIEKLENEEIRMEIGQCLENNFYHTFFMFQSDVHRKFYAEVLETYLNQNKRKIYLADGYDGKPDEPYFEI